MEDIMVYFGEFAGTMILIVLGNGVVANVVLAKTKGNNSGWIVIAIGWGLAVAMAVCITGWISGAHLNPAVTIALAVTGAGGASMSLMTVFLYVSSQLAGAIAGSCLVYLNYKNHYDATTDPVAILSTFATAPEIRDYKWNMTSEILGTAMLVGGILGIGDPHNTTVVFNLGAGAEAVGEIGIFGALVVGCLVCAIGLSMGGPTGYAINPARDLGPRIAHAILPIKGKGSSDWQYSWVPIAGPLLGGILGALMYEFGAFIYESTNAGM